jgi:hypothetical protein
MTRRGVLEALRGSYSHGIADSFEFDGLSLCEYITAINDGNLFSYLEKRQKLLEKRRQENAITVKAMLAQAKQPMRIVHSSWLVQVVKNFGSSPK